MHADAQKSNASKFHQHRCRLGADPESFYQMVTKSRKIGLQGNGSKL